MPAPNKTQKRPATTVLNRFPLTYRTARALGLALALVLLAGSVATVHLHKDGFAHYSDCDSCLQIQLQSGVAATSTALAPRTARARYRTADYRRSYTAARAAFAARAPPQPSI